MSFREQGIEPADGFTGNGFLVRRLLPSDNLLDYAAVMSSREFLYHWEQDPPYPPEDFTAGQNLEDLEKMHAAHDDGLRYTYTVMSADETEVLGCVYILPNDDRMYQSAVVTTRDGTDLSAVDATIAFWVRVSTWDSGFERILVESLSAWLSKMWSLTKPVFVTNEHLIHQVGTLENLGFALLFDYRREQDMYMTLAYG